MIFLTLGTQLPFDRLVEATDKFAATHNDIEIFGQITEPGVDGYTPDHFEWVKFLEPDAYQAFYDKADIIVAHAGMGSIISALTTAKPIVIMPRKASLGEHRNEHQLATAEKFQNRSGVYIAWEQDQLGDRIEQALTDKDADAKKASPFADPSLISAISDFIHND